MNNIRETVRNYIVDNFLFESDGSDFSDDADLKECRLLDSLAALRLMTFIEDEFQVRLEIEDMESGNLFSLAGIERLILSRIGQRQ